jgi:hypothetical protein
LLGWVALVGGIREYARFRAAGIPSPAQTASLLPRGTLIADGLSALLPALAIAVALGLLAYVWARAAAPKVRWEQPLPSSLAAEAWVGIVKRVRKVRRVGPPRRTPKVTWSVRVRRILTRAQRALTRPATCSTIVLTGTMAGWVSVDFYYGWGVSDAALGPVLACLLWSAFRRRWLRSPLAVAATVLLVTLVNAGAAAFLQPLDSSDGEFESVIVTRRGRETVSGFYLARSGGEVYVAVLPAKNTGRETHAKPVNKFAILEIPESEAELVQIGPVYSLSNGRTTSPKIHAVVTQLREPEGPGLLEIQGDKTPKPNGPSANSASTSTTTTINKSTNNNTTITTTVVTEGIQQSPPTPPVIQTFAPNATVPASDHFCFPIGAAYREATIGLRFSAPTLEARGHAFRKIPDFSLGAHKRRELLVTLNPQIVRHLRAGQSVPVNAKVTATSNEGAESTVTYRLNLQRPSGLALFRSGCSRDG